MLYVITTLAEQNVTVDPTQGATFDTVQIASVLIGTVIPILVALVTKHSTRASVKSILLAALSALTGFLTEFINSADFVWQQALLTSVVTFVTATAAYFGLWKNTVDDTLKRTLVKD